MSGTPPGTSPSSLQQALDDLKALAAARWSSPLVEPAKNLYPHLAAAVEALNGDPAAYTPKPSRLERARESWENYRRTLQPPPYTDLAVLCWDPAIAPRREFCALLAPHQPLRGRALRGLLASYHLTWSSTETLMSPILLRSLRELDRVRGKMEIWSRIAVDIVGPTAPERMAGHCVKHLRSASEQLPLYGLGISGNFAEAVAGKLVEQATSGPSGFPYAISTVFPEDNALLSPVAWGQAFNRLVLGFKTRPEEAQRQAIIDLALKTRGLKDPRIDRTDWQNVPETARNRILEWLSEEDLRFFFDLLMQGIDDDQDRRSFWLSYIAKAKRSRVAVGAQDMERLRPKFRELESRGRSYARIVDAPGTYATSSVFIMEFEGVTVVEFSRSGSACYVYGNGARSYHFDLSKSDFRWDELKNTKARERLIHTKGRWHSEFRNKLAQYGIRPA